MPDDILDAAQKAINDAAGKLQDPVVPPTDANTTAVPPAEPTPATSTLPAEPAPEPIPVTDTPPPVTSVPVPVAEPLSVEPPVVSSAPSTQQSDKQDTTNVTPPVVPQPPGAAPQPSPDASKLVESILDTNADTTVVAPPPSKPKKFVRKKSVSGAIIGVIALLLLALPVGVYYISQQNHQLADIRSQATGSDPYQGASCSSSNPCG